MLTGTLAIATIEFVFRTQLLSLFGSEYTNGSLVLVLFIVAQTVNGAVGPAGWLLSMTDHQYIHAANDWGLGILNLGLSVYFIVEFGLIGAAIGTASSLAIINILSVGALWYLEGLFPYTTAFLKPIAASVGMGLLLVGLTLVVPESVLLFVGIPTGIVTFALLLFLFGIEHRDRQLFGSFLAER